MTVIPKKITPKSGYKPYVNHKYLINIYIHAKNQI